MSVDKYRRVEPCQVVEVLHKRVWHKGRLYAWRRDDGRWLAYVEFSHPNGVTQPKWFDQDDIRPSRVAHETHLAARGLRLDEHDLLRRHGHRD